MTSLAQSIAPEGVPSRLRTVLGTILPVAFVAVLGIAAWYLLSVTVYRGKAFLFPGPMQVARAMIENGPTVLAATLATLREASLGYIAAIVLGVTIAGILSQSRLLERCIYPYAVLLQTVPVVAVAPLIVLWFGYNDFAVIVISLIISLFPIINNTLLGLHSTSRNLVELFAMHRTSRTVAFWKLRFPSALPSIMAGLRISAGLSVIGAIIGEFIIGSGNTQGGLGVQIIFAQGRMYTALLFAEVICATVLGFIFFALVSGLGAAVLRHWHESAIGD
jgi:NitT/TauT family transport system permease protein